ncbi:MAG TPA: choice-of-anchor tandem repeat GloVer-containing protein [Verrucomicrobiae bacterium]|nr:choice-of-anchor tandem repeat GloVer-containing protein [Verrucomicrobiae bacterium]
MRVLCIFAAIMSLALAVPTQRASAATLTPLWQFGGASDGAQPEAPLVQGLDGNLYGTTSSGTGHGLGAVFRITPAGGLTNLYAFTGGSDGGIPSAGLIQGSDSNFYGTTYFGGNNTCACGTVFEMTSQGTLTTLWRFTGGTDGSEPIAKLVQGFDGNFYGTASGGGTDDWGTVFQITPQGTLTTLWQFSGGTDGGGPEAGLVQGVDSNFYGTTYEGGTNAGFGTVFKITPQGTLTTLYRFSGGSDGSEPEAELAQGADGNFYGTTFAGGLGGRGTIFKVSPSGTFSNVYRFTGGGDGSGPEAPLYLASDGNFYGTAEAGGTNGFGAVFELTSAGALSNLWQFGGSDGSYPLAGLIQGSSGFFYGTTYGGGTNADGSIFKLSTTSLSGCDTNFVPQISAIQIIGTNVVITLPTEVCQTYQLQYTELMVPASWNNTGSAMAGTGSAIQLTDVGGGTHTQRFYRVQITNGSVSSQAAPQISSIQMVGSDIVIAINALAEDKYQLQYSDSMLPVSWNNIGGPISGVSGNLQWTNTNAGLQPQRFYQVMVTIPQ